MTLSSRFWTVVVAAVVRVVPVPITVVVPPVETRTRLIVMVSPACRRFVPAPPAPSVSRALASAAPVLALRKAKVLAALAFVPLLLRAARNVPSACSIELRIEVSALSVCLMTFRPRPMFSMIDVRPRALDEKESATK